MKELYYNQHNQKQLRGGYRVQKEKSCETDNRELMSIIVNTKWVNSEPKAQITCVLMCWCVRDRREGLRKRLSEREREREVIFLLWSELF